MFWTNFSFVGKDGIEYASETEYLESIEEAVEDYYEEA